MPDMKISSAEWKGNLAMSRGQNYAMKQELRDVQHYGQGTLSLEGCRITRTTPSYKIYDYYGDPVRVYDEPSVQCFSLQLRNMSDAPIEIIGVETQVQDYWCMRPVYGFTVDYLSTGMFDVPLERTGNSMHALKYTVAPGVAVDWDISVASFIAHIKCYTLYAMSLCVHYGESSVTNDSGPMVLAIYHRFSDYDITPGFDGYDPRNPFDEKVYDDGLSNMEQDWNALCRFGNYPGIRNKEFLREYDWYRNNL